MKSVCRETRPRRDVVKVGLARTSPAAAREKDSEFSGRKRKGGVVEVKKRVEGTCAVG